MTIKSETVWIPTYRLDELKAIFDKMDSKAKARNIPAPTLTITDEKEDIAKITYTKMSDAPGLIPYKSTYNHTKCVIDGVAPVLKGWKVAAKLDHSLNSNLISIPLNGSHLTDDEKDKIDAISSELSTCKPNCDHCKSDRNRKETYILINEGTKSITQVGSTCVDEFLGSDSLLFIAQSFMIGTKISKITMPEDEMDAFFKGRGGNWAGFVDTKLFMAVAALEISRNGYVSSSKAAYEEQATFRKTKALMFSNDKDVIEIISSYGEDKKNKFLEIAEQTINWAKDKPSNSSYNNNCITIARTPNFDISNGLFCATASSMPHMMAVDIEKARVAEIKNSELKNEYFGKEKERGDLKLTVTNIYQNLGDMYPSVSFRMVDDESRTFGWKASYDSAPDLTIGQTYLLKGTVKGYYETRDGVKVTDLSRCADITPCEKDEPAPTFLKEKKAKKVKGASNDLSP